MSVLTAVSPLRVNSMEMSVPIAVLLFGNAASVDFSTLPLCHRKHARRARKNVTFTMLLVIHQNVEVLVILTRGYSEQD